MYPQVYVYIDAKHEYGIMVSVIIIEVHLSKNPRVKFDHGKLYKVDSVEACT